MARRRTKTKRSLTYIYVISPAWFESK